MNQPRLIHPDLVIRLTAVAEYKGSDLHFKGHQTLVRVDGELRGLDVAPVGAVEAMEMICSSMSAETERGFRDTREADYAIVVPGVGRFRANAFFERGMPGLVARLVKAEPVPLESLNAPPVISTLSLEERGLILVTGPTGSGKTTLLGGMIDLINRNRACHILTIEDPIEIMHTDHRSTITQREVHTDTTSFATALRGAMRQDPDVILIGEMRDTETVRAAVSAAETGHLVLATLHSTNATESIARIVDFFPVEEQQQVRIALAESLKGVVCQRLVAASDGIGRVPAMEILVNTENIAACIVDAGRTHEIEDFVANGEMHGMQTFDQHLVTLVLGEAITITAAKRYATDPHDMGLLLKRAGLDPAKVDAA